MSKLCRGSVPANALRHDRVPSTLFIGHLQSSAACDSTADSHFYHLPEQIVPEVVPRPSNVDSREPFDRSRACARGSSRGLLPTDPQASRRVIMPQRAGSYFHLHLVSDATGETLITVARAADRAIHQGRCRSSMSIRWCAPRSSSTACWPRSRNRRASCSTRCSTKNCCNALEKHCRELGLPCLSILGPVLQLLQSYLGAETIAPRRRPAHAQCRILQAHRCAQLHHAARRRPASRGPGGGRRGAGRRVPHVEDADLDLSRQSRRQDRQRAAGAGRAAAAPRRGAVAAAGGRALCQPRAHRADPAEPPARPQGASR